MGSVLEDMRMALDFDKEDPSDDFKMAKIDLGNGNITLVAAQQILDYMVGFSPDWIYEERSILRRLCKMLAGFGLLEKYAKPEFSTGQKPQTLKIDKVEYIIP